MYTRVPLCFWYRDKWLCSKKGRVLSPPIPMEMINWRKECFLPKRNARGISTRGWNWDGFWTWTLSRLRGILSLKSDSLGFWNDVLRSWRNSTPWRQSHRMENVDCTVLYLFLDFFYTLSPNLMSEWLSDAYFLRYTAFTPEGSFFRIVHDYFLPEGFFCKVRFCCAKNMILVNPGFLG